MKTLIQLASAAALGCTISCYPAHAQDKNIAVPIDASGNVLNFINGQPVNPTSSVEAPTPAGRILDLIMQKELQLSQLQSQQSNTTDATQQAVIDEILKLKQELIALTNNQPLPSDPTVAPTVKPPPPAVDPTFARINEFM